MRGQTPALVHRDDVRLEIPQQYGGLLSVQDCEEIAELFAGTTRNPNHCISKGQYARLTEQLGARNKMLEKRVTKLYAALVDVSGCFDAAKVEGLAEALAETTDERLKDLVERRLLYAHSSALDAIGC